MDERRGRDAPGRRVRGPFRVRSFKLNSSRVRRPRRPRPRAPPLARSPLTSPRRRSLSPADFDSEEDTGRTPLKTPGAKARSLAPETPGDFLEDDDVNPLSPRARKSPSDYDGMTELELQKLREFRGALKRASEENPELLATPALRRFVNDACLARYLRARNWKVKKALKVRSILSICDTHWFPCDRVGAAHAVP